MPQTGSAAWVVVIVCSIAFIMGALILTATDPVMQALFSSNLWTASTADGQNALNWQKNAWNIGLPLSILLALLLTIWIETRQPT